MTAATETKPKFKLTAEFKDWCGIRLFRIEATTSFGSVKAGDKGGWVQKEENLSQVSGNAWVFGNVRVSGDVRVGKPLAVATRSDGYFFALARSKDGRPIITAGCRFFESFDAARQHWRETRGGTSLGEESLAILDYLERLTVIRPDLAMTTPPASRAEDA